MSLPVVSCGWLQVEDLIAEEMPTFQLFKPVKPPMHHRAAHKSVWSIFEEQMSPREPLQVSRQMLLLLVVWYPFSWFSVAVS
jgi:hypothetical protein